MSETLDTKIFELFIQVVKSQKLLSDKNIDDFKKFADKNKVTSEDWELLVDKDCFPDTKEKDG